MGHCSAGKCVRKMAPPTLALAALRGRFFFPGEMQQDTQPDEPRSGRLHTTMDRIGEGRVAPDKPDLYLSPRRVSKKRAGINLRAVAEVLTDKGLDPTVELVEIIKSGELPLDVQARVLTTLMEYVHPKRKSVEITGADGGAIQVEHATDAMLQRIAMQAIPLVEDDRTIDV